MAISGAGLAMATGGGVLVWAGLSGVTPLEIVKSASSGQKLPQVTVGSFMGLVGSAITQLGKAIEDGFSKLIDNATGGLFSSAPGGSGGTAVPAGMVGPAGPLNAQIATAASKYAGVPYVWGGATPSGWDCSGFVTWVLHRDCGLNLPDNGHTVSQTFYTWSGARTVPREECQPGDLVCWITHVAIATGPDTCIGAENHKVGTVTGKISSMGPGGETYLIRRVIPQGTSSAPTSVPLAV